MIINIITILGPHICPSQQLIIHFILVSIKILTLVWKLQPSLIPYANETATNICCPMNKMVTNVMIHYMIITTPHQAGSPCIDDDHYPLHSWSCSWSSCCFSHKHNCISSRHSSSHYYQDHITNVGYAKAHKDILHLYTMLVSLWHFFRQRSSISVLQETYTWSKLISLLL